MKASAARKVRSPRSISGWALGTLVRFDEVYPGTLRFALSGSPLRRQAIFLTLSCVRHDGPEQVAARLRPLDGADKPSHSDPNAVICRVLMTSRVREIVHALYGFVEGLAGALSRLGDEPLHPVKYRTLVALLTKPEHEARSRVLRQMEKITPATIAVLFSLKPPFVLPDLAQTFASAEHVHQFHAALELIRHLVPEVTDEELVNSLKATKKGLSEWLEGWVNKARVFPVSPPFHGDPDFVFLSTAEAIRDVAMRYKNCLKTKLPFCALGRFAYFEYRPSPVIVELASLSQGQFLLQGIYGPGNNRVDLDTARVIKGRLADAGVLLPACLAHASRYNKVARLMNVYDFDLEFPYLEDDAVDLQAMVDQIEHEVAA